MGSETPLGAPRTGFPAETAEIFRHEINNPLTGILGNVELFFRIVLVCRHPPCSACRSSSI
jgi:hypothetical protein